MLSIVIFFILYKFFNIFIATIGLVITTFILTALEYIQNKRISKVTLINLAILVIMSLMTIILDDSSFIKMKPTFLYLSIASLLLVDILIIKKMFIGEIYKKIFEKKEVLLTKEILKTFTIHWIILLFSVALTNEIIWRNFSEDTWVSFKVFFIPIIIVVIISGHISYINKYVKKLLISKF